VTSMCSMELVVVQEGVAAGTGWDGTNGTIGFTIC